MDTTLRAATEKKFNKKQADCLLTVFEQVGIRSWHDLQNLPIHIGLPAVCGQSVYELVETLNLERTKTVEVVPVQAEDLETGAEQGEQPDPKPKRRSRNSDAKEIENNGQ